MCLRYLGGLIDLFGKFDGNGDGVVEFDEFPALWAHLGGEPPIAGAAQLEGNAGGGDVDPDFDQFDLNADGVLSARGASAQPPSRHLHTQRHARARAHAHTDCAACLRLSSHRLISSGLGILCSHIAAFADVQK